MTQSEFNKLELGAEVDYYYSRKSSPQKMWVHSKTANQLGQYSIGNHRVYARAVCIEVMPAEIQVVGFKAEPKQANHVQEDAQMSLLDTFVSE